MIWLVYERATGVVVASITADAKPTVMSHHDTMEYNGDKPPVPTMLRIKTDRTGYEFVQGALDLARERAVALVNRKRDAIQNGGCKTALGIMQSDEKSRQLLLGAIVGAQFALSQGQSVKQGWTMADNVTVEHTAMQLMAAGVAMAQHIDRAHFAAVSLKAAINAAETIEAIESIDIEAAPWTA